jgi:PAP2 superfamily protein
VHPLGTLRAGRYDPRNIHQFLRLNGSFPASRRLADRREQAGPDEPVRAHRRALPVKRRSAGCRSIGDHELCASSVAACQRRDLGHDRNRRACGGGRPIALWRTAVVRWFAFVLNELMLVAIPAYGSHYVVDVMAGFIVAVACWIVVMHLVSSNADASRMHLAGIDDSPSIVPKTLPEPDMVRLSRRREQA